ncbi:MAG: SH3 domain-containing protein [Myxococcales bacterium]|nr:SH3 domain-containing protein [Myxococcales bacterium]
MEENAKQTAPPPNTKHDRIEVLRILGLALLSFVAGFALIYFLLKPDAPPSADGLGEGAPTADAPPSQVHSGAPDASPDEVAISDDGVEMGDAAPDAGDAPPEVPPGKTPDNIALDGSAYYLKCWDAAGAEYPGADCDKLDILEKRFSTRLYVVEKCRADVAPKATSGKLSIAAEVDFSRDRISFWNGASSDIADAAAIGQCLRTALAGLPIHGIQNKHARYRLFFTVLFGKTAAQAQPAADAKAPAPAADAPKPKGRQVNVKLDKVRVRRAPVDGEIIGRINSGNQVTLIGQKGGWCQVYTPAGNEGWMTCDALEL